VTIKLEEGPDVEFKDEDLRKMFNLYSPILSKIKANVLISRDNNFRCDSILFAVPVETDENDFRNITLDQEKNQLAVIIEDMLIFLRWEPR
jgi:hypothetical protein